MVASDSLAVLASLKSGPGMTRLVSEIAQMAEGRHSFVYIPSHQGHEGNEMADQLAKAVVTAGEGGGGCAEGLHKEASKGADVEGLGTGGERSGAWAGAGHGRVQDVSAIRPYVRGHQTGCLDGGEGWGPLGASAAVGTLQRGGVSAQLGEARRGAVRQLWEGGEK